MAGSVDLVLGAPDFLVLHGYYECRNRVSSIIGPLGSGKTNISLQRLMTHALEQKPNERGIRPSRWYAVRNTYPDLTTTTIKDFLAVFEHLGTMKHGGNEPPRFEMNVNLEDGTRVEAEFVFLALDREDSIRKLQGSQVTGFWLNEMKELAKGVVDMCDLRHGRYPKAELQGVDATWHGMWGDSNAPDEDHWLYHLAEEQRPETWSFFRQPGGLIKSVSPDGDVVWLANPRAENLRNLPAGYYDLGKLGKDDDWIAVMLGNLYGFVREGKPVHPWYNDQVHASKEELVWIPKIPLVLGIDFGRTPAASFQQFLPVGRHQIIDEFLGDDMSASIFAPELKLYIDRHYPNAQVLAYCDPAGEARGQGTEDDVPLRIIKAAGIPAVPAHTNSPTLRRAAISGPCRRLAMDGKPAFLVSPRARKTRKALMGGWCYRRMQIKTARGEDVYQEIPDKGPYSHIGEATEYGMMGNGEGRIALQRPEHHDGYSEERAGPRQEYGDD